MHFGEITEYATEFPAPAHLTPEFPSSSENVRMLLPLLQISKGLTAQCPALLPLRLAVYVLGT